MAFPETIELTRVVRDALSEDTSGGDLTTNFLITEPEKASATFISKEPGVISGFFVVEEVFKQIDPQLVFDASYVDGDTVNEGIALANVSGNLASILKAERTALNFLQRMSGISTFTAKFVRCVKHTQASIVDTRKTVPGLRSLDKYAVTAGGGINHRRNLGDGILIKDNHIAVLQSKGLVIEQIIQKAREYAPRTLKIEVEVETLEQVESAIKGGADILLLDNMSIEIMRRSVELCSGKCLTEASGGITLNNVIDVAETGVDMISIGAITHSVQALDISLDIE